MKPFSRFIGIDLGTGSCKSVVVDEEARVLGFGAADYAGLRVRERWQEQDPQDLLRAAVASARRAVANSGMAPEECAGLSLGGALHSLVALDAHAAPLTGVMTWADARAVEQCAAVRGLPVGSRLYRETGCPCHAMYPLYKILWLQEHRPELFRKTWRYVSAKEYVFARMSGEYRVDYSLAAGSALLNTHTLRWNPLCLDMTGIREDQLSPLCSPFDASCRLSAVIAGEMGLRGGVPLVMGSSDACNSNVGAGAVGEGQAVCMVGTSGALRILSRQAILDEKARAWCYAVDEGLWLVGGAINNAGLALSWLRDCLNQACASGPGGRPLSFEDILALGAEVQAGADGVMCLPFFAGERSPHWNPNARALFFGLTLDHGVRHLARALLEGIAFRFRSLKEVLIDMGVDLRRIVASGGFTKSDLWLQVVADTLGRDLTVPAWGETSALGAALWAMLGVEGRRDLERAREGVKWGEPRRPDPENVKVYDRAYPVFEKLYEALEKGFDEVAQLQAEIRHGNGPGRAPGGGTHNR